MTMHQEPVWGRRQTLILGAAFSASLTIYWFLASATLWWAYSVSQLIQGGYYDRAEAISVVGRMALIVTVLTAVLWFIMKMQATSGPGWRSIWSVGWRTAIILVAYTALVVIRRNLWQPSQGTYTMFLPVVGGVNGKFFSEFNWLSYLLVVTPIVSLISGCLYAATSRLSRRIS